MSLTGSLFAGVSGLNSQGSVMGVIGDNIANISTVGFKSGNATFSSLVTGEGTGSGSLANTRLAVDQQGIIQSTGVSTDIAISGQGMFVVKDSPNEGEGQYSYTRAGSFRQDDRGFFVNSSGFVLQAWQLDGEGRLPGELGNLDTTPNQRLDSTTSVNTRDISGVAFATTTIGLGLNLDAGESILAGSGSTVKPGTSSTLNQSVAADDVLAPTTGEIEVGDILTVTLGSGTSFDFDYGGVAQSDNITASAIFGASTATQRFATNVAAGPLFLAEGHQFTITTATAGTVTYTFNEFTPNVDAKRFNSLQTLSDTIDATPGLESRIVNGRLTMAPTDATEAITLADVGAATFIAQGSFDTTDSLFANTTAATSNRFASLSGLAALVNAETGISATISGASSNASISINVDDPLQTIQFTDDAGNAGVLLTEFDITTGAINPSYDATAVAGGNMANGTISPAFSRNIRVFDSLGTGHDMRISFVKSANNTWLVEAFMANPSELTAGRSDGQIASGTIEFNGDGSLRSISSSLTQAIDVEWSNDAETSSITLDLGTSGEPAGTIGAAAIGLTDGLSQFDGPFNVQFAEQNGAAAGLLSSVEIDEEGFIIANFSNGQSREVFKIPLATFPNPNGLKPQEGNVFQATDSSGTFSLNQVGDSGVGKISVAALEGANVDLATELTKMIVAQRAFQANTKIITTSDELLEELNRI